MPNNLGLGRTKLRKAKMSLQGVIQINGGQRREKIFTGDCEKYGLAPLKIKGAHPNTRKQEQGRMNAAA
jgi:hypothetical protein